MCFHECVYNVIFFIFPVIEEGSNGFARAYSGRTRKEEEERREGVSIDRLSDYSLIAVFSSKFEL